MTSPDLTEANIDKLAELFPDVITETLDADGNPKKAVDFDMLRQELSDHVVEGPQERYRLDWPGKREAAFAANAPIAKTLRPIREESVDFDTTKNLFIDGDNLDALKLLQESYLGKVRLIYIDPPYNTGSDLVYRDDFAESTDEYLARSSQISELGERLVANTETNGRFHWSRPKAGVKGAGRRFCFETAKSSKERTYARACTSIADRSCSRQDRRVVRRRS